MEGMLEPEEVEDDARRGRDPRRSSAPRGSARSPARYVTEGKVTPRRQGRASCATAPSSTTARSPRCAASTTTSREVAAGFECGIVLRNFQDVKEGDILEVYETRKVERELA